MQNSNMNKSSSNRTVRIRVLPPNSSNREDEGSTDSISVTPPNSSNPEDEGSGSIDSVYANHQKGKAVVVYEEESNINISASSFRGSEAESSQRPTCNVCQRLFPSKNALFGHLRMHSQKEIKKQVIGDFEDSSNSNMNDLKWKASGKRGRKGLNHTDSVHVSGNKKLRTSANEQLPGEDVANAAMQGLMLLRYGRDFKHTTQNSSTNSKRLKINEGSDAKVAATSSNAQVVTDTGIAIRFRNNLKISRENIVQPIEKPDPKAAEIIPNTGNSTQIPLENPNPEASQIPAKNPTSRTKEKGKKIVENSNEKGHVCSICGMSFSLGQALGGHMALHKKKKPKLGGECRVIHNKISHKEHKCKICGKTFPKGQELGGHMKAHRRRVDDKGRDETSSSVNAKETGEVMVPEAGQNHREEAPKVVRDETSSSSVNAKETGQVMVPDAGQNHREEAPKVVRDFDLNEMGMEEDEDN